MPGKRVRWPATDLVARSNGIHVEIASMMAGGFEVRAQWPTMEGYDDDPGSVLCGCPWQGRSHAHCVRAKDTLDAAWELYEAAKSEAVAGRVTCLGAANRI